MAQLSTPTVRACLITNPKSGQAGEDLSPAIAVLRTNGWDVQVRQKQGGGDATTLARTAAEQGCTAVIGCGGDGTLSEIVDGLAGSDVAVGVIPGGTVNLWAAELGFSARPRVAAQQLVTAARRRADLGHLEINGHHGQHFLLMAGIGFDGAVVERISKPLKQRLGGPAVWLAALKALPAIQTAPVRVELDGMRWAGRISQLVAGNTRRYGGFATMTPAAHMDDALLDICLFTAVTAGASMRQAASLLLHGQPSMDSAEVYRAGRIAVHSPVLLPVQIDGGRVSLKHVQVGASGVTYLLTARAGAITVLVPSTYDGGLFLQPTATAPAAALDMDHPGPANISTDAGPAPTGHEHGHEKKRRLTITHVGMDSITGVRVDNGNVLTAIVGPATVAKDGQGEQIPMATLLSSVQAGDEVRIKGSMDSEHGLLMARQVKLRTAEKR